MVSMSDIQEDLSQYFIIRGKFTIDPHSHVVDVQGAVKLIQSCDQMPVQFGRVDGAFACVAKGLTTLKGAPAHVGGNFHCDRNLLSSLEAGPQHVEGSYCCESNLLTDLSHMPSFVGDQFWCYDNPLHSLAGWDPGHHVGGEFWCTYGHNLPLLRCIQASGVSLSDHNVNAPGAVSHILNKYAGKGKSHMLNCALELKQAGYAENARW
jgi:hypothetical protein